MNNKEFLSNLVKKTSGISLDTETCCIRVSGDDAINFLQAKFYFLAIIFSLIAQAGDLTISFFKRLEKVKDTGKILPGHGGILDRIDGLMFVVIVAFILIQINIIP